jgi:hypothetical protein
MANENFKKTIKTNLDFISGTNNTVFTGVDDLVNMNLDPYVSGYAFIYWVQLPEWFKNDEDLKHYKLLSQKNFNSFQGMNPIDLGTAEHQTGFAGNSFDVVTGVSRGSGEFTISHKEYRGGVMRKMYQKWITMIRDPRTGIALYPKLYNVDYSSRNHTGQLLYIVTSPDVTSGRNNIEHAVFYSNVFPTNVPFDTLYNYERGNQESPTIDISFKGFPEFGPDVDEYAKRILNTNIMASNSDSYLPFVDSYGTNIDANRIFVEGSGTLKDIYNYSEE